MKRCSTVLLSSFVLGAMGLAMLAPVGAQDKKDPNVQDPPKGLKINPKTKALQDLALSANLITFGREHKNAESLLLAAKIIHTTPTEKLKADSKLTGDDAKAPAAKQKDNSPKALLAEAKAMSSAPHIEALAAATQKVVDEETRGLVGGPYRAIQTVGPGQTWTISGLTFVGGQLAVVDIDLYGVSGRFIMTVHDQFGNLVRSDSVPGPFYNCRWVPAFTGPFTVRLTNIDTIAFRCDLLTN